MNVKTEKINNQIEVKKNQRDSNIEFFRIITMLLIIAHHYVVNSGLAYNDGPIFSDSLSTPSLFLLIFGAWGKIGINCFVLITGYFMCKSNITAKKFAKLIFEVIFYDVLISTIFLLIGYNDFTFKSFIKDIIPITSVARNFTGTYIIFFLCIPFLNILIKNLSEKNHVYLLLISSFTYIFFGTIPFLSVTMNYVSWYMVLYFISSYIRLYPKKIFDSKSFWGVVMTISIFLSVTSVIACTWLGVKLGRNISYIFVTDSNNFLAVLTGVSSFMFFKNINFKYNKFINSISMTTFGVLLIHTNSENMRKWLWEDILNNVNMYYSKLMPLHAFGSVICIFIICSVIDYCRICLIEKPFFKLWDKHWSKISLKYKKIEIKFCEKFNIQY